MKITTDRPGWISPPAQPFSPEHAVARPRPRSSTGNASITSSERAITVSDPAAVEAGDDAEHQPRITDRPVPMKATVNETCAP